MNSNVYWVSVQSSSTVVPLDFPAPFADWYQAYSEAIAAIDRWLDIGTPKDNH